ncbi:hypothetical protein B0H11DRAFT_1899257 [Mycena galericulata]|nr:hypothetical protein B0H11DRAFT_1899257 [Mycena galericulata]
MAKKNPIRLISFENSCSQECCSGRLWIVTPDKQAETGGEREAGNRGKNWIQEASGICQKWSDPDADGFGPKKGQMSHTYADGLRGKRSKKDLKKKILRAVYNPENIPSRAEMFDPLCGRNGPKTRATDPSADGFGAKGHVRKRPKSGFSDRTSFGICHLPDSGRRLLHNKEM